jgi:hypothetical protein
MLSNTGASATLTDLLHALNESKGKGKAILLQAWTDPKGCRRLMLSDFKTIGT